MSKRSSVFLVLLCLAGSPSTSLGFVEPSTRNLNHHGQRIDTRFPTFLNIRRLFTPLDPKEQRQRLREQIEDLEDEDFLMADIKPKVLVHERDFFRQSTRIQAWDSYVLVSVLCTSISYGALQNFSIADDHRGIFLYESIILNLVHVVAGVAVLAGLYSTMVFSLCILYSKTALGLEKDPNFDSFLDNTGEYRLKAFYAFSWSLACFAVLVVLTLAEQLPLLMHLPIGGLALGALFVGVQDWKAIVGSANNIYLDD